MHHLCNDVIPLLRFDSDKSKLKKLMTILSNEIGNTYLILDKFIVNKDQLVNIAIKIKLSYILEKNVLPTNSCN